LPGDPVQLKDKKMKYVITGSLGHISKPVVERLAKEGHQVTVITSNGDRKNDIEALGATAAVGSVEDAAFITSTFSGADAVYLMIPPNWGVSNWLQYQQKVADNYAAAITANNVKYAVQLSSIGAHMRKGAGPVDGLGYLEEQLLKLPAVNVKMLRPSYFYYNLFGMIPLVKGMSIMGANYGGTEEKLVLVHTSDIADAVYAALSGLQFTGHTVEYIASDERTTDEIAAVLSAAIDKPGTPWVVFSDEQSLQGMRQAGLSETIADGYNALGMGIRTGAVQEDYWKNRPASFGKIKLEDFAREFAAAFNAPGQATA
jgi:uncharacterized protein YbjT (DUF2867 family)